MSLVVELVVVLVILELVVLLVILESVETVLESTETSTVLASTGTVLESTEISTVLASVEALIGGILRSPGTISVIPLLTEVTILIERISVHVSGIIGVFSTTFSDLHKVTEQVAVSFNESREISSFDILLSFNSLITTCSFSSTFKSVITAQDSFKSFEFPSADSISSLQFDRSTSSLLSLTIYTLLNIIHTNETINSFFIQYSYHSSILVYQN